MKTLVTYKSFYGSSKQYALWIGEELNCDVKSMDEVSKKDIENYDVIIHGGGLYAGGISGLGFYKKNKSLLDKSNTKLIVFACGASPYNKKVLREMEVKNFSNVLLSTPHFYCEGNYDFSVMNIVHKAMMRMMNKMLSKRVRESVTPDPQDEEFLSLIFSHFERCNKQWIKPIIEYVNNLK